MKLGSTPVEVKYGAYGDEGGFVYKNLSGNVKCLTTTFKDADFDGDPAFGRDKNCFVAAKAPSGKKIATHGQKMLLGSTPLKSNMALTVQMAGLYIRTLAAMSNVVPQHSGRKTPSLETLS